VFNRRLADLVVVIHALTAVFFFFGGLLALGLPWLALMHLPLAAWVIAAFIMGWTCPLTPLEITSEVRRASKGITAALWTITSVASLG
jgi:uncharacterized protein DUF2784